jgi:PhnB protein
MKEIITYLNFDGNCREAMTFYGKCLDAQLELTPFSAMQPNLPKEAQDRIMHARLIKGSTAILMASDIMPGMPFQPGTNFSVSVHCDSVPEIERFFGALGEKGAVTMPLQDTPWGARFGMLKDRFGIHWMFNFDHPKQA